MGLSTEGVGNPTGNGTFSLDENGILAEEGVIKKIKDISGLPIREGSDFKPDLGLQLTLGIDRDFDIEVTIVGNLNLDADTPNKVWSSAFKVAEAIKAAGVGDVEVFPEKPAGQRIPKSTLQQMLGKRIIFARYYAGRKDDGRYLLYTWGRVIGRKDDETVEEAKERISSMIYREYADSKGRYPKGYMPEMYRDEATPSGDGAPAQASAAPSPATEMVLDPDEELPF